MCKAVIINVLHLEPAFKLCFQWKKEKNQTSFARESSLTHTQTNASGARLFILIWLTRAITAAAVVVAVAVAVAVAARRESKRTNPVLVVSLALKSQAINDDPSCLSARSHLNPNTPVEPYCVSLRLFRKFKCSPLAAATAPCLTFRKFLLLLFWNWLLFAFPTHNLNKLL